MAHGARTASRQRYEHQVGAGRCRSTNASLTQRSCTTYETYETYAASTTSVTSERTASVQISNSTAYSAMS
ncbi:hypothetical protein San01_50170 [Streptomyces angustmyceticus]|uniref:Uncharacterized protein n=1 Tax=Streptomyces angustmyceticus TaxID=285578 RepID=A0A5J4LLS0_9ACTN|nr:hypothetical protein San01_50170 [Streptomyces angustmyceticus]